MFNRELRVKMVRSNKKNQPETVESNNGVPVKMVYATSTMNTLIDQIGRGIIVYMLLDTFRQVMVERAKKA